MVYGKPYRLYITSLVPYSSNPLLKKQVLGKNKKRLPFVEAAVLLLVLIHPSGCTAHKA